MIKSMYCTAMLFLIVPFCGCDDEQCVEQKNCIESVLKEYDMIPYTGEELGCKFFMSLFEFQGQQYFQLGSNCADMETYPFGCDGNQLCENVVNPFCSEFREHARQIGIVGMTRN